MFDCRRFRNYSPEGNTNTSREDGKSGSELYIVAEYDYEPRTSESLSNMTYGGRGSAWIGEHLQIGGTYIKEEKEITNWFIKENMMFAATYSILTGEKNYSNYETLEDTFVLKIKYNLPVSVFLQFLKMFSKVP